MTDALQPYLDAHAQAVDELVRLAAMGDPSYLDGLRHHVRSMVSATLPPPCTSPAVFAAESPSVQVGDTGIEPVTSSVSGKRTVQVRGSSPRNTVEWWCAMLLHVSWWRTAILPGSCTNPHLTGHTARHRPSRTVDHQEHLMTATRITPAPESENHDEVLIEPSVAYPDRIIVTAITAGRSGMAYADRADAPALALAALLASGVPAPTVEHCGGGFEVYSAQGRFVSRRLWVEDPQDALAVAAAYLLAAQTLAAGPPAPEPDPEAEARAAVPDAAVEALHDALKDHHWTPAATADVRDLLVPVLAALKAAESRDIDTWQEAHQQPSRRLTPTPTEPEPEPAWTPAVGDWVVVRGTEDTPRRVEEWDGSRARVRGLTFRQFLADLRPATPSDTGAEYLPGDPIPLGGPEPAHHVVWTDVDGDLWQRDAGGWHFNAGRWSWAEMMQAEWPEFFPGTATAVPAETDAS